MPYPFLRAVLAHRTVTPVAAFLLVLLCGLYAAWRAAMPDLAVVGLVLGFVAAATAKLLVEVLELLADMLLPK